MNNNITTSQLVGDSKYLSGHIVFASSKGDIVLNPSTGKASFPEGMSVDEASKQFWDGFVRAFGGTPTQYKVFAALRGNEASSELVAVFSDKTMAEEYSEQINNLYSETFVSTVELNPPLPFPFGVRRYVVVMDRKNIIGIHPAGLKGLDVYFTGELNSVNGVVYSGLGEVVVEATNEEEARRLALLKRDEMIKAGEWKNKGDKLD